MTKSQFKKGIEALKQAGEDIVRSDCEGYYIHKPSGTKLHRTTNWIRGGVPFDMTPANPYYGCLAIGTAADQMVRDYFVEGMDYLKENAGASGPYANLSPVAQNQLISAIRAYDECVIKPQGWKVLADRVFLYSLELGVAGEVDLILYNEETREMQVIDMKTIRSPEKKSKDKVEGYTRQLNTYRTMAEELTGIEVTALQIMWIKVWYEKKSSLSSQAYITSMENIPMRPIQEEVMAIWKKAGNTPSLEEKAEVTDLITQMQNMLNHD